MTSAILDTNIFVQSLISSPRSASARVLDAYFAGRFELIYSAASLDELLNALLIPKIRRRHALSDDEVLDYIASLVVSGRRFAGTHKLNEVVRFANLGRRRSRMARTAGTRHTSRLPVFESGSRSNPAERSTERRRSA
jgi:hypothetical protein